MSFIKKKHIQALSLKENFFWITLGSLVYSACQWGLLVLLAKFGSPEMVGQFSFGLAITAPIIMLTNLQLRAVEVTDVKNRFVFTDFFSLRLIMTSTAFSIIILILLFGNHKTEIFLIVLAVALAKSFESMSDISYGVMQKHERMDYIGFSMIIKGILSILVFGLLILTTKKLTAAVLGLASVWLFIFIFYDLSNARLWSSLKIRFQKDRLISLFKLAFPLGLVAMLVSLSSAVPRYFVISIHGESDLGYFTSMAYVIIAVQMIVIALGQSARPQLAKYFSDGDFIKYRHLLLRMMGFGLLIGTTVLTGSILWGREFLTLLYKPDYAEHAHVFVWLMIGGMFYYEALIMNDSLTAAQHFKIQVPLFLVVNVSIITLCFLWVPEYGILGAAKALVAGRIVHFLLGLGINLGILRNLSFRKKGQETRA